ncbi:alpha-N-arabinofuranosidase [Nocardioides sp. SOB77]|uniref:non-reducing end alpha-L-arabinofuranosidase n=1 Tax=Nocardioides oceani TaxID=3058369 RepID=A0ABT8FKA4_9ACTN|nr:alpha-N-arabinofuranosidase [Nocardioides oceani]MDN4175034.1 alpha-N-arabinofuranosidase [Nocardioides oceani]
MTTATLTLDPSFTVGAVDRRLFGSFVEHMGRCVYTGIHEPGHPTADERGFRGDVLDLVRELGPTIVRYPGGNFVSGYRWEDGIGPLEDRPRRLDLAWRSWESNQVGVDEFVAWCRAAGTEPMMAVNLGTRGVREAVDLLEYCNHPGGTAWSDLRRAHGAEQPHDVRVWCLGNELDGPWQIGQKTAWEYGRLAAETAHAMRRVDPRVELVACGSSNSTMPTFASWEATVLAECYEVVDHVSLHNYYDPLGRTLGDHLASGVDLDRAIDAIVATADHVGARLKSRRRLGVSVDEWNVWYQSRFDGEASLEWAEARPLIEDTYDVADAAVVGSLLITLLRHADRVSIACQAQLVNVIAPIRTEAGGPAWRQTIFHPFAQAAAHARGEVLRVEPRVACYDTADHGEVPLLDATATHDPDTGALTVLAVNRSTDAPLELDADARAFAGHRLVAATTLAAPDVRTTLTAADQQAVAPSPNPTARLEDGRLTAALPPVSWNVLRLEPVASPRS